MPGVITTGSLPKMLWPGLNEIWGQEYSEHPEQFPMLFDISQSEKNYEEDMGVTSFGLVPVKTEGSPIEYDSFQQFYVTRYTNVTYGLGFIITREQIEDNQYWDVGVKGTKALAFSFRQTQEIVTHNIYNDGFAGGPTYGDGKVFFANDHPIIGGTFSNVLSPGADISEAALEDLLIQIGNAVDTNGKKIALKAQTLHVPVELQFDAKRILGDPKDPAHARTGTADRDINAMYFMGMFPGGYKVHNYFDDPDAFFVRTNLKDAVRYFNRRTAAFEQDNDFDTENAKFKVTGRFVAGVTDPRGAYASAGA